MKLEQEDERLKKGRFGFNDLAQSGQYYYPLYVRLLNAQLEYLIRNNLQEGFAPNRDLAEESLDAMSASTRANVFLNLGLNINNLIGHPIESINRGFVKLLEQGEVLAAYPLIRLQMDNLTYLYAELQHPFKVLYKVFVNGRTLNQIKIKGEALNPTELRKQLDKDLGTNIYEMYRAYSCYIHPNKAQHNIKYNALIDYVDYYNTGESRKVGKDRQREFAKDMVLINQIIGKLLMKQIESYNSNTVDLDK